MTVHCHLSRNKIVISKSQKTERIEKGIHRNNYLNCWESVIKQYRNGSVEFPQQKDIRNNP